VFIDQGERNTIRNDADSDITESTDATESRDAAFGAYSGSRENEDAVGGGNCVHG
jgi:hypothetical protein